jgi:leader peptidase (prepilin peptidase)/N-methyltransferase
MTDETDDTDELPSLRPNGAIWLGGSMAIALLSAVTLGWPDAIASTILGALMIAGADVDARLLLLPNAVTGGAVVCGLAAATLSDPLAPWLGLATSAAGAVLVASLLWIARILYAWLRQREGIGLGDVKLAAAVGAWLPPDAVPGCFFLASVAALIAALLARWRGERIDQSAQVPFGAFLCLSLWLVDYATRLMRV